MGAALAGVGAVDKGKIGFVIVVGVGEGKFQRLISEMDRRINPVAVDLAIEQIEQPIFREKEVAVEIET